MTKKRTSGTSKLGTAASDGIRTTHQLQLQSETIRGLEERASRIAKVGEPILLVGETGCGKEVLARRIHEHSNRRGRFVAVNSYDFKADPNMAHSEIFGHVKGAFTGATSNRDGAIAETLEGTLFIDEIGALPNDIQGKILRFLDSGEYRPLGGTRVLRSSCRIVAASNEVRKARFGLRDDLYFRFAFTLELPPLRERIGDLIDLFFHFTDEVATEPRLDSLPIPIAHILLCYDWPGNVRELKNRARAYVQVYRAELLDEILGYIQWHLRAAGLDETEIKRHHSFYQRQGLNGVSTTHPWFMPMEEYFKKMWSMRFVDANVGHFPPQWFGFNVSRTEIERFAHDSRREAFLHTGVDLRSQSEDFLIGIARRESLLKINRNLRAAARKVPQTSGTITANLQYFRDEIGAEWALNPELPLKQDNSGSNMPGLYDSAPFKVIRRQIAERRLSLNNGNKSKTSVSLDISRDTLNDWLRK